LFLPEIAGSIEYIELKTPDDIVITRIWDVQNMIQKWSDLKIKAYICGSF
jgi:hypothetical protein